MGQRDSAEVGHLFALHTTDPELIVARFPGSHMVPEPARSDC